MTPVLMTPADDGPPSGGAALGLPTAGMALRTGLRDGPGHTTWNLLPSTPSVRQPPPSRPRAAFGQASPPGQLRRPLWLVFRVLFTGVSLLFFVWHSEWVLDKCRHHSVLHSMGSRSYPAAGFELPGVTLCVDRPYGAPVRLSFILAECAVSGQPCSNSTVRWRRVEELTRVCFTGSSRVLGDRRSPVNGFYLRLRFPADAPTGAMYDVYVHEPRGTRTSFFSFSGEKNVEVPLGELVKQELRLNERLLLDAPGRPCRAEAQYSATDCLNGCFQDEVVAQAGAGCRLDWFVSGQPVCAAAEQRYNVTLTAYRLGLRLYRDTACAARCPPACLLRTYSLVPFSRVMRHSYRRRRIAVLVMHFSSTRYARSTEQVVYGFFSVLADTGSALGFLLGLSLLAVLGGLVRLLCWLLGWLLRGLVGCWRRSRQTGRFSSSRTGRVSSRDDTAETGTD